MQGLNTAGRARFVSFSGVDGAGKSTQIAALRYRLEQEGLQVRVITFWDNIARLTGLREGAGHRVFKGDKGIGSPDAPINRRDKNVQSWPMSCARLGFYLLDAMATRRAVRQAMRSGADFIIFDRYMYDELANLNLRNAFFRAYVRAVMKYVPRPDVSYILDADPVQARARKPEYPIDFIHINRRRYMDLAALLGCMTVIEPGSVEEVKRQVLDAAQTVLAQYRPSGGRAGEVSLQRAS